MPVDQFWGLIAASQPADEAQPDRLLALLKLLSCEEKQAFSLTFCQLKEDAYRWDIWGAAYLYGGGCSDDSFMDFRSGLIAQGRGAYESVLADPDDLATLVDILPEDVDLFFEDFGYVHYEALKLADCTEPDRQSVVANAHPLNANLEGNDWDFDDEQEMRRRYPQLWKLTEEVE